MSRSLARNTVVSTFHSAGAPVLANGGLSIATNGAGLFWIGGEVAGAYVVLQTGAPAPIVPIFAEAVQATATNLVAAAGPSGIFTVSDNQTASAANAILLRHKTSGVPTYGFGIGINFSLWNNGGLGSDYVQAGGIYASFTDATAGTEDSRIAITSVAAGAPEEIASFFYDAVSTVLALGINDGQVAPGLARLRAPRVPAGAEGGAVIDTAGADLNLEGGLGTGRPANSAAVVLRVPTPTTAFSTVQQSLKDAIRCFGVGSGGAGDSGTVTQLMGSLLLPRKAMVDANLTVLTFDSVIYLSVALTAQRLLTLHLPGVAPEEPRAGALVIFKDDIGGLSVGKGVVIDNVMVDGVAGAITLEEPYSCVILMSAGAGNGFKLLARYSPSLYNLSALGVAPTPSRLSTLAGVQPALSTLAAVQAALSTLAAEEASLTALAASTVTTVTLSVVAVAPGTRSVKIIATNAVGAAVAGKIVKIKAVTNLTAAAMVVATMTIAVSGGATLISAIPSSGFFKIGAADVTTSGLEITGVTLGDGSFEVTLTDALGLLTFTGTTTINGECGGVRGVVASV